MEVNKTTNCYNIPIPPTVTKRPQPPQVSAEPKRVVSQISDVTNDSAVKVPMKYTKIGELELPYKLKAHCYKLSNGQRVVILPKEGETVLRTYVNTGSMNEPDNIRGISHYIEHNLFNGSQGLQEGEFFATTNKMGASTNASTGFAETNYYISSNLLDDGDLEKKIKLHASMLETPKFTVEMLEKEKGVVNSEINMITSDAENELFNLTLKKLFNIKTSSNDMIAGTTDNITNLTRKDVVDYFDKNYYPANMVTVVSGEIEPEETMRLISKSFSSMKQPPKERYQEKFEPVQKTIRQDVISQKANSTFISVGFVGPENKNVKDRMLLQALGALILHNPEAKEAFKNLNAEVYCENEKIGIKPTSPRAIMLLGETNEENSEKLLKTVYENIHKYQNNPPTEKEMKNLKRDMKRQYETIFESSFSINDLVGSELLTGNTEYITNFYKILDEISAQDIQNAAKKYFTLDKNVVTVVHPKQANSAELSKRYKDLYPQKVSFTGKKEHTAINLDNVQRYNLPNNYVVATNNIAYPTALTILSFRTKKDLDVPPAQYYILEEILRRGSVYRTSKEFNEATHDDGIGLSFDVSKHGIEAFAAFDSQDMDKTLGYMEEVLNNPRFSNEEFQKIVADVRDSILRMEASPMDKLVPEILCSPARRHEEILKSLDTVTLADIQNLYARICNTSSATAVVSANFSDNPELKDKLLARLSAYQAKQPFTAERYSTYKPQQEAKVFTKTANKNQAKIVLAYKFKNTDNMKDKVSVELMNIILGGGPSSRLFNDLREQQKLAYSVSSDCTTFDDCGMVTLQIGTTTDNKDTNEKSFDNIQKSIEGFKTHINKLVNEYVSEEELEAAKLVMKNNILSERESKHGQTVAISTALESPYGLREKNIMLDMIDSITAKDINTAAKHIFATQPIYSIVASDDTLNFNQKYLETLGKMEK